MNGLRVRRVQECCTRNIRANSVRGARRTTYAAEGLQLSTMFRRPHLDAGDELVVIRVDEQDVKKTASRAAKINFALKIT